MLQPFKRLIINQAYKRTLHTSVKMEPKKRSKVIRETQSLGWGLGTRLSLATNMALTNKQVEMFHRDGYVVVKDFLSQSECDILLGRTHDIIADADLDQHPTITFNTRDNLQSKTDYFINSGDKIRFFFEEGAIDGEGKPKVPIEKSLNKIGHALHILEPEFKKVTCSEKIQELAKSLDVKKPAVVQSMVIFKQPNFGGAVNPHQDSSFLFTSPMRLYGVWIALEDADIENGCLWFAPGTHMAGITRRMLRTEKDGRVEMTFEGEEPKTDPEKFVPVPVKKGGMVVIHGEVVHKSAENKSSRSRNIFTFHFYDAGTSEWSKGNWLQPTEHVPFPHMY